MTTSNSTIVHTLGPYDILSGRGKTAYNNVGNRRFRTTMTMNLEAYLSCKSKIERSVLAASIVDHLVEEAGARFLKLQKDDDSGYVEMNAVQAREKVAHALRDMAVAKKQTTIKSWTKQERVARRQKDLLESKMKAETKEPKDVCLATADAAPSSSSCCLPLVSSIKQMIQPCESTQYSKDTLFLLDKIAVGDWEVFAEPVRSDCFVN